MGAAHHSLSPPTLALLNHWQRGFPLVEHPFAAIAQAENLAPAQVLATYTDLQSQGFFSRIGAVFAPGAGGASLLAAMQVPPARLDAVAAIVSGFAGVNHNYEREHLVNLWFVATGSDTAQVEQLLCSIEAATNLPVLRLPMVRPYRIDTGFDLRQSQSTAQGATHWASRPLAAADWPLAALAEQGLALTPTPYADWATDLGCSTTDVLQRLQAWLDGGLMSRFGVVVRHHELGFAANAMTVFDVPAHAVDACGLALAQVPGITLAYQRVRVPGWNFNLYCMVHGRDRAAVQQTVAGAIDHAQLAAYPRATLFSLRRFKQTGARRFTNTPTVTPAKAGVQRQRPLSALDSRLRGNDGEK